MIRVQNRNDNAKPNPNEPMKINKLILISAALAAVTAANAITEDVMVLFTVSPLPFSEPLAIE